MKIQIIVLTILYTSKRAGMYDENHIFITIYHLLTCLIVLKILLSKTFFGAGY
jgi:hypothetical protein